ncbi:DUF3830 family protein [Candidatus Bathyarchaeota archaeon]|nr:DUF3830 family protein [Candidatus Bathyarchaeota archaeon]
MTRELVLKIPEEEFEIDFLLFEDEAPETCRAILQSLPIKGSLVHTNFSGQMIVIELRGESIIKAPKENLVKNVRVRDVTYWYSYWDHPGLIHGVDEYAEIGFVYGRHVRPAYVWGEKSVNLFGVVSSNYNDLFRMARRIRVEGAKEAIIELKHSGDRGE